jgi:hypothetical protein
VTQRPGARVRWPGGKAFAFTIFDDTDLTTLENGPPVYRFITDLGFRVTKSVWPLASDGPGEVGGSTCAEPDYLDWVRSLQAEGHEIGFHNATDASSTRDRTREALDRFRELFGSDPSCGANHSSNAEAIYWGSARLSGPRAWLYDAVTRGRYRDTFHGEDPASEWFWGDLCRDRVRYWRNFTFPELNTLEPCPRLPYRDPDRPFVDHWFASTDASNSDKVTEQFTRVAVDELEASGGACILYTHLGSGFWWEDALHPGFVDVMTDMATRNGWFAPVGQVLDHLRAHQPDTELTRRERAALERRWIRYKLRNRAEP